MNIKSRLVSRPTKPINYAIGMFGTSIPINMFKTYAFIFYVDKLSAITTEQFALILAIYTIVDAIDNPIYGFLSDSTRSAWGRRRPWLVIGAPLLALSFIMFFNVPAGLAEGSVFYYALIMYIFTGTLDSLINANYGALFPELFKTEKDRAKTNALRQAFQLLAMIISIALTPMITGAIGYRNTALIYSVMAVAVILYMTFNSHETPEAQQLPKPNLFSSIWAIAKNPKFWLYGLTNAAFFAALAVLQQSVSFYAKYVLRSEGAASTIMLATVIVVAMLAILAWVQVIKKLHLMKTWRLALLVVAVALIPLFFTQTLVASTLALVVLGFGYGGVTVTMDIVAARILDEDKAQYGVQREGTFSSLTGILNKTSGLFAAIGFFMVSRIYGYQNGEIPGPQPADAARFLISIFPFIIMVVCVLLSLLLKFKENTTTGEVAPGAVQEA
ncbi:MAG TPA: MFS transporter [Anaerolineaceae bacterium]|nr:MFS transporter [Anaerolineaceae bacterium]